MCTARWMSRSDGVVMGQSVTMTAVAGEELQVFIQVCTGIICSHIGRLLYIIHVHSSIYNTCT